MSTKTATLPDVVTDPVLGIRVLPDGPFYLLDDFRCRGRRLERISIGRTSSMVDIVIDDENASKIHCILDREGVRVFLERLGKNATPINGVALQRGRVELRPGLVLLVGTTRLLVCGQAREGQQALISSPDLHSYLHDACGTYGSQRKASGSIGIKQTTLGKWLRLGKFLKKKDKK